MQEIIKKSLRKPIELEIKTGDLITIYESKLFDIRPETISVLAPQEDGSVIPIDYGSKLKILITDKNILFVLDTEVTGAQLSGPVPLLILNQPGNMKQIQRRNNFRVPAEQFSVNVKVPDGKSVAEVRGTCMEISGGGMMVALDRTVHSGSSIELNFTLSDQPSLFSIIGQVKRVDQVKRGKKLEFRIGIFFSAISDKMRDNIVKYTFRQQRKLIQRKLL